MTEYSLPVADEPNNEYYHYFEVLEVLKFDAGPCVTCDKPMSRLLTRQHIIHQGLTYSQTSDMSYAHADGSEHHGRRPGVNRPKPRCPGCDRYGTLKYTQEAYLDRTRCEECGWQNIYMIGD